jgi:hypothetical protein
MLQLFEGTFTSDIKDKKKTKKATTKIMEIEVFLTFFAF